MDFDKVDENLSLKYCQYYIEVSKKYFFEATHCATL